MSDVDFNVANATSNETTLTEVDEKLKALMLNSDAFFLIIMGIVVFLMQVGFAFLEAGVVRSEKYHSLSRPKSQ